MATMSPNVFLMFLAVAAGALQSPEGWAGVQLPSAGSSIGEGGYCMACVFVLHFIRAFVDHTVFFPTLT
jgi:hypothetical protein